MLVSKILTLRSCARPAGADGSRRGCRAHWPGVALGLRSAFKLRATAQSVCAGFAAVLRSFQAQALRSISSAPRLQQPQHRTEKDVPLGAGRWKRHAFEGFCGVFWVGFGLCMAAPTMKLAYHFKHEGFPFSFSLFPFFPSKPVIRGKIILRSCRTESIAL